MTDIAYVGFDCPSKAIHGVVMDNEFNIIAQHKWASKEKTFEKRFPEFATNFCNDLSKIILNPKTEKACVAIEQAVFIQNPRTTVEIANVIGCVRTACYLRGFDVKVVDNTKWKKAVLGKGNSKKSDIMTYAKEKWGDIFPEQDFADAACIAAWAVKEDWNDDATSK